jgi:hypothetical protein
MAHTLLLYDPMFLLVVDDDTYVSINMLAPGGLFDNYIRKSLSKEWAVLGQLTKGRKITKKGFYYGGAGYLMGKKVIDLMNAYTLDGPQREGDQFVDAGQMHTLSLLHEVFLFLLILLLL